MEGRPAGGESISLSLPPHARFVRVARLVGSGLANELGFDVERLDDVRLAIGEACALVVQAGASEVGLTFTLDGASLLVSVRGTGAGDFRLPDRVHLTLVDQVLAVACSEHSVEQLDGALALHLTFSDDR